MIVCSLSSLFKLEVHFTWLFYIMASCRTQEKKIKSPRKVDLIYNLYTLISSKFYNSATGLVNNEIFHMRKLYFLSSFKH